MHNQEGINYYYFLNIFRLSVAALAIMCDDFNLLDTGNRTNAL